MNAHTSIARSATADNTGTIKYRLRIADYLMLHEQGSFRGQETELVDGEVYLMSPEWRPHLRIKSELAYQLRRAVEKAGLSLFVGVEGSIALSETDLPRPDILLTSEIEGEGAVPGQAVPLVIEVSSTTLSEDMGQKAERYAAAGIAEYWVVDVNARLIHQMWAPADNAFTKHGDVQFGELTVAQTIANLVVSTQRL